MRTRSRLLSGVMVAASIVLAGCSASTTYTHPTKTTAGFQRESYDGKVIAELAHYAQ